MGGEQAASVLATIRRDNIEAEGGAGRADEEEAFKAPVRERYEAEGNPLLRHRAPLGRRHHPAVGDARRAGAGPRRSALMRRSRRRGSACSGCDGASAAAIVVRGGTKLSSASAGDRAVALIPVRRALALCVDQKRNAADLFRHHSARSPAASSSLPTKSFPLNFRSTPDLPSLNTGTS